MFWRKPDFVIGNDDDVYLRRWWLVRRNGFLNIYLHQFIRSDDDRALHDHPWSNISILLTGRYKEVMPVNRYDWVNKKDRNEKVKMRYPFIPIFRDANWIHRIELMKRKDGTEKPMWTLFITGPWRRPWGFWCHFGWRYYKEFVAQTKGGNKVGRGCE